MRGSQWRIKFLDDYYRQFIHKVVKNGCYLCHVCLSVCLHAAIWSWLHGFSRKLIWGSVTKIFQKIEVCLTTDTSNRLTSHSHEDLNKFMHISYCILLYWVKFQVKGVEKIKRTFHVMRVCQKLWHLQCNYKPYSRARQAVVVFWHNMAQKECDLHVRWLREHCKQRVIISNTYCFWAGKTVRLRCIFHDG
jgi:hypothetical protein